MKYRFLFAVSIIAAISGCKSGGGAAGGSVNRSAASAGIPEINEGPVQPEPPPVVAPVPDPGTSQVLAIAPKISLVSPASNAKLYPERVGQESIALRWTISAGNVSTNRVNAYLIPLEKPWLKGLIASALTSSTGAYSWENPKRRLPNVNANTKAQYPYLNLNNGKYKFRLELVNASGAIIHSSETLSFVSLVWFSAKYCEQPSVGYWVATHSTAADYFLDEDINSMASCGNFLALDARWDGKELKAKNGSTVGDQKDAITYAELVAKIKTARDFPVLLYSRINYWTAAGPNITPYRADYRQSEADLKGMMFSAYLLRFFWNFKLKDSNLYAHYKTIVQANPYNYDPTSTSPWVLAKISDEIENPMRNQDGVIIRDTGGKIFGYDHPDRIIKKIYPDVSNVGYQDEYLRVLVNRLNDTGADGLLVDTHYRRPTFADPLKSMCHDSKVFCDKYTAGFDRMTARISEMLTSSGKYFFFNSITTKYQQDVVKGTNRLDTTTDLTIDTEIPSLLVSSGATIEHFGADLDTGNVDFENDIMAYEPVVRKNAAKKILFFGREPRPAEIDGRKVPRYASLEAVYPLAKFTYASYLLLASSNTSFSFTSVAGIYSPTEAGYSAHKTNFGVTDSRYVVPDQAKYIGYAAAPYVKAGYVYTRAYSKGFVIVNSSNTLGATVSVPAGMEDVNGDAITAGAKIMAPRSALVLYKTAE